MQSDHGVVLGPTVSVSASVSPPPTPVNYGTVGTVLEGPFAWMGSSGLSPVPKASRSYDDKEFEMAVYSCELIQEAGIMLKIPQVTMGTGQVLFHRFFTQQSMRDYDPVNIARSSLFLACKIVECPKHPQTVLTVWHHLLQKKNGQTIDTLMPGSNLYSEMREDLIKNEHNILRELGFMMYVELPHKFILNYLNLLEGSKELGQSAWNYANDSLRTSLCIRYQAEVIAVACIFMAAERVGVTLPITPDFSWWELFDVSLEEIQQFKEIMTSLYKLGKPRKVDLSKRTEITKPMVTPECKSPKSPPTIQQQHNASTSTQKTGTSSRQSPPPQDIHQHPPPDHSAAPASHDVIMGKPSITAETANEQNNQQQPQKLAKMKSTIHAISPVSNRH
ncbi:arginine-rich cyclin 1 [Pelomyxa schiedti]|nr:arginine-rich cyclin 1 [Pelomyxa schiedti]